MGDLINEHTVSRAASGSPKKVIPFNKYCTVYRFSLNLFLPSVHIMPECRMTV